MVIVRISLVVGLSLLGFLLLQGYDFQVALLRSFLVFVGTASIFLVARSLMGIVKQRNWEGVEKEMEERKQEETE
jgi:hypothetical protein